MPWKSQSEWQRTDINGESTSMEWPTLRSSTAKEQNKTSDQAEIVRVSNHAYNLKFLNMHHFKRAIRISDTHSL